MTGQIPAENIDFLLNYCVVKRTLNNNDLNQVADWQFSLKQWFAVHSYRLRKTGSAHCYLRISVSQIAGNNYLGIYHFSTGTTPDFRD